MAEADERFEAAAGGAAEEPVGQDGYVLEGEAGSEDPAQGFFERVGEPYLAAGVAELSGGPKFFSDLCRRAGFEPMFVDSPVKGVFGSEVLRETPIGVALVW